MSYPRISASWETIGAIKVIADQHGCYRDDEPDTPCVGELLYQIAEGELFVINKHQHATYMRLLRDYAASLKAQKP